jgi:RNA polymerase sigma factor (sigma-70 family)
MPRRREFPAPHTADPQYPSVYLPDNPIGQPATALEALMQAAPGDSPELSLEERRATIEAVAECVDSLPPFERFLIEAYFHEGLSYRELAARLGRSRMDVYRKVNEAVDLLRRRLLDSDDVNAYLEAL